MPSSRKKTFGHPGSKRKTLGNWNDFRFHARFEQLNKGRKWLKRAASLESTLRKRRYASSEERDRIHSSIANCQREASYLGVYPTT